MVSFPCHVDHTWVIHFEVTRVNKMDKESLIRALRKFEQQNESLKKTVSALQSEADASRNPTGFSPWEECKQPNNFTKTLDFP